MHGVKISSREAENAEDVKERLARQDKFERFRELTKLALQCRKVKDRSPEGFNLSTKILSLNPDCYSLWAYRREVLLDVQSKEITAAQEAAVAAAATAVSAAAENEGGEIEPVVQEEEEEEEQQQQQQQQQQSSSPPVPTPAPAIHEDAEKETKDLVQGELRMTLSALKERNPKSYCTWWHRRWLVDTFPQHVNIDAELKLCDHMLQLDERNFHCWGYRHHIASILGVSSAANLIFSTKLVERNFSNYSAWNFRASELFKIEMVMLECGTVKETLLGELEFVQNAFFTEPADQSAWMYFKWIVEALSPLEPKQNRVGLSSGGSEGQVGSGGGGVDTGVAVVDGAESVPVCERVEMLKAQLEVLGELLDADGDSKWPLLASVWIFLAIGRLVGASSDNVVMRVTNLCERLTRVDPVHSRYHQHLLSKLDRYLVIG